MTMFALLACIVLSVLIDRTSGKIYPSDLNLNAYTSYQMAFQSDDGQTEVTYSEFTKGEKRRLDMETMKPQHGLNSFRTNGSSCYSILTDPQLNEHTCTQEPSIEQMFDISEKLKLTWSVSTANSLLYVGDEKVDDIDCNVWRFVREKLSVDVYTSESNSNQSTARLRKMVIRHEHGTRVHETNYFNFDIKFNAEIGSETFELPVDCNQ